MTLMTLILIFSICEICVRNNLVPQMTQIFSLIELSARLAQSVGQRPQHENSKKSSVGI